MASRSLGSLTLDLVAKIGGFTQGMDQAARIADARSRSIQKTMSGLKTAVAGAFAAIGGASVVKEVLAATIESENALRQLNQRLASTGGAVGLTSDELTGLAESLQNVSTFEDDAIVAAEGLLLAFTKIRGDNFTRATEAALDLSIALKQDLNSSISLIGKALNNPLKGMTALQRAGVQIDESQQKVIKRLVETGRLAEAQGLILDALAGKYGGAARAASETLGGALEQVRNSFGNLFEADTSGLDDATSAVKDLNDLLKDPATKEAAQALTGALIVGFAEAARIIRDTFGAIRSVSEEVARIRFGAAIDDVEGLRRELEQVQALRRNTDLSERIRFFGKDGLVEYYNNEELDAEIENIKRKLSTSLGDTSVRFTTLQSDIQEMRQQLEDALDLKQYSSIYQGRFTFFGENGLVEYYSDADLDKTIADLRKKIEDGTTELKVLQVQTTPSAASSAVTDGTTIVAPPSEEFETLSSKLKEQIALFGKVSEAAKIAYQIESGALDELSDSEQKQVLQLARRLDGLTEFAKARDALKQQSDQLQEQVALFGKTGQAAKVSYQIQSGSLKTLTSQQQEQLVQLARQLDALAESAEKAKEAEAAQKQLTTAVDSQVEAYQRQISLVGKVTEAERIRYEISSGSLEGVSDVQKAQLESLAAQTDAVQQRVKAEEALTKQLEEGKELTESLRTPQEKYAAALEQVNVLLSDGAINYETYSRAVKKAQKELDEATNQWTVFKDQALRNTQDIIADTLENSFQDGFDGIVKSFGEMLKKLAAQAVAADIAKSLFGESAGGTGGGLLGTLANIAGAALGGRAAGGQVTAGELYQVNENGREYFRPATGGEVIPLGRGASGMTVYNQFTIQSNGGPISRSTELQIAAAAARGVDTARRRNG